MYKFGTIILIPFPFTDLSKSKIRPALIVSQSNLNSEDITVCFITAKKTTNKSQDKNLVPVRIHIYNQKQQIHHQ